MSTLPESLTAEVNRRRTFAIISHPDAGKTTLTEKLLLYAGAIEEAGSVRARRSQRHAVSDWMSIEQERGISITSTVLQFEYEGHLFNLLDTPGHQDFSEDTYRTLVASDSAVMVLDSAKGIEAQTKKLFEVCRQQNIPILTFINKLDHPGREPLELLDEIEKVLGIQVSPMNWPIGSGSDFKGVYDIHHNQVLLFQRTEHNKYRAPVAVKDLYDPALADLVGEASYQQARDEIELLLGGGTPFDRDAFLAGDLTPIYFGSALNNFGVNTFLQALIQMAPAPHARPSNQGQVEPTQEEFSGFVFKIQANMDPRHRDRMVFLRVCSGRFEKDMMVHHSRLGRNVRMSRSHRLFARDRETVEFAYPGDIIGLSNPGIFMIGDTVCTGTPLQFEPIPPFQPELFCILRNQSLDKYKQFNKGVDQLREEGVVQVFYPMDRMRRDPIVGAVGRLQFDVVLARLAQEYGVEVTLETQPYTVACWVEGTEEAINQVRWGSQTLRTYDQHKHLVVLLETSWQARHILEQSRTLKLKTIAGQPFETAYATKK